MRQAYKVASYYPCLNETGNKMFIKDSSEIRYRAFTTPEGSVLMVPEFIYRIDNAHSPGWQLRFGEWTDYADQAGRNGSAIALKRAIEEMMDRIEYRGK